MKPRVRRRVYSGMRESREEPRRKLVITGTGRSGTTLLVRLLTELGFDTGFTSESWRDGYYAHCSAGLEHELGDPSAPYVVKNPALCDELEGYLASGAVQVDHVLIPMRELDEAAQSRIQVGGEHGNVPGGLIKTASPEQQASELAVMFHRLMHTLTRHEIPFTLLEFPRFARDPDYTRARLAPLLGQRTAEEFRAAFDRVVEPGLIHDYRTAPKATSGSAAAVYRHTEKLRRRQRRLRRVVWAGGALLLGLAASWLAWS